MEVNIINFKNEYEKHFYDLNIEWLNNFFEVEEYDHKILSNAKKYIIDKGGKIFFAILEDKIIATVALMPTENELIYELTKMAVKPKYRNKGIGKKLLNKCVEFSNYNGYESIILYSNKKLRNAIHLYKLFGFEEIKMEIKSPYSRANIKMIKKLN
ncbi:MAG: GNAT family N-acetyltransferase [Flavobacteriaceae bacterium]|jgi:ribosomal protein S18 acetylase RimI-like enzyme|nr:GNAT family N-acetyltransferase [Flavobacteriaceae bacterium]OUV87614.1 MAG: GNAT family N-acetyltransferase [Flavobacteriaceae bacterium TMED145]|tara:strand:+ start:741 stop:1208 length:468 start_codon:yes stop_codon:yes gene_type:complete